MKISVVLLFICLGLAYPYETNGQNALISLKAKNQTVSDVLEKIEKQSNYFFFYNNKEVDVNRVVSIDVENKQLRDVLDMMFGSSKIQYSVLENSIILSNKEILAASSIKQGINISGMVRDENGQSIPGVNVLLKGTSIGVVTDINGKYAISVPDKDAVLVYSFVGYITNEFTVGNQTTINIELVEDTREIEEVVVVGYGTQRKGELTSSIASVKSDNFVKGSVQDAAQLLQGKVAGLGVVLADGNPQSTTQITLRGVGTLKSGTSPLVIIDGVPGDLTSVAPEDIESMDVVKDGSAAAIYGTRGNNGVIFITTKKVKGETPLTVDINAYMTVQKINKKLNMMNASQYRELVKRGEAGAVDLGYSTDWLDEILRTPVSGVFNVSFKGGSAKSNYIANVNYKSGQGIVQRSNNDLLTTRLEVNHNMWDNLLKFNFNIMGREQTYQALGDGSSFNTEIYRNALNHNPTDRPKDDAGNWTERKEMYEYYNPVVLLNETSGKNKSTQLKTFGSITLTPIDPFFIKALVSHTSFNQTRGYAETKKHTSTVLNARNGYASRSAVDYDENLAEITAQYKKSFEKHNITALVGYSYQDFVYEDFRMTNFDFPSDQVTYNRMEEGAAIKRGEGSIESEKSKSVLIGWFGRVNYNYDNRYLASVSLRHEGSSKFGADHKWGNFPAASLGWNISNEEFLQDVTPVSNLKLRAGFGITGTIPDDPYMSLSRLATGDNFYANGVWTPTLKPSSNANPDLRWEKKEEWNFGIDFGFLNERISGSIDLYKRNTKDMLWDYQVATPPFLYSDVVANAASMENKGIEIHVSVIPLQTKDFEWVSTINYSTNKNKLVSLSNDKFQLKSGFIDAGYLGQTVKQSTHRLYEGGKAGNFYGYKTVDIDADGRWIIAGQDGKPKPIIEQQSEDKQVIGNGLPQHYLSWDNSFTYKNFDLNITMRGAFKYDILNVASLNYDCPAILAHGNVMTTAYDPKIGGKALTDKQELQYVSHFIEKGDFWKIDNITLGYNLTFANKYVKKLRVYASGSNLLTITSYSGIDPEVNVLGLDPGIDFLNRYPSVRSFTLGAMLYF